MNKIRVPGILYSMLLAAGAWAVEYFTTGTGADVPWAAIALAAVPVILKLFTVNAPEEPVAQAAPGGPLPQPDSKGKKFVWG